MTLRLSSIVLGCAALLMATQATAQTLRPSPSVYLTLRGGATVYGGELDGTGTFNPTTGQGNGANGSPTAWLAKDFSYLAGAELGYQFTRTLGFGVGFNYANYSNLDENAPATPGAGVQQTGFSEFLPTVQAAFRYLPLPDSRVSPFVNLGAQFTFGKDGNVGDPLDGGSRGIGYGPYLGAGLDFALSNRLSLFLESNFGFIFDDYAVDGLNPGANTGGPGAGGDAVEFDVLGSYGGGFRFHFARGVIPVDIEGLQCPSELFVGESGSFMAMTNADATMPVDVTWNFGDMGMTGSGMSTSHSFSSPGTYTVTAMAMNSGGDDSESCLVTVNERPIELALTGCRATPSTVDVGQQFTVNATATGATSVMVDFGDGTTANALPASHSYTETGNYTVTITAMNGSDTETCRVQVAVGDQFCTRITELNPVYFGFNGATLTADARARLDENIEILRRCPAICVTINGYTDDQEGDQTRLSQRRADATRDYYIAQGIDASRLRANGRGQDPNANNKEDPGPGDSRARRADSIPSSCTGF